MKGEGEREEGGGGGGGGRGGRGGGLTWWVKGFKELVCGSGLVGCTVRLGLVMGVGVVARVGAGNAPALGWTGRRWLVVVPEKESDGWGRLGGLDVVEVGVI